MSTMEHIDGIIQAGLAEMGLTERADPRSPALLDWYSQRLLEKNQVMNLTAITEPKDVASLHMLDCAALLNCADFKGKTLIDVGTGAGFPGIVLNILVPSLEVTLLDSLAKRLDWLLETAGELSLQGVTTLHARAEEAGRELSPRELAPLWATRSSDPGLSTRSLTLRESFDFATARAVADLRMLCELCLPFVKVGGRFLAMKGPDCDEEIDMAQNAIQIMGGKLAGCYDYTIPGAGVTHRVVIVEKVSPTPARYPRRWAKLQNHPL